MKMSKYLLLIAITISTISICPAQNSEVSEPEKNWLAEYNIYPTESIFFRYRRYSKEDLKGFRERLDSLKESKSNSEWSGVYYSGTEETVNHSELHIDSNAGFIEFNIYTCLPELQYVDYGKITETEDSIQIAPEFVAGSTKKSEPVKYVKVKWGKKYLLVEESILPIFAEKAVGIYVEPENDNEADRFKWMNFWVKGTPNLENHNQVENEYEGLLELPQSYQKFQHSPIEAKIISVGNRRVEKTYAEDNDVNPSMQAVYKVTINAGKNQGVKVGMIFEIPQIGESVAINKVNQDTAFGEITRDLDESKNEYCISDTSNRIDCAKITNSLKVKTPIGNFWF